MFESRVYEICGELEDPVGEWFRDARWRSLLNHRGAGARSSTTAGWRSLLDQGCYFLDLGGIVIESDVWIGAAATITPGVTISGAVERRRT